MTLAEAEIMLRQLDSQKLRTTSIYTLRQLANDIGVVRDFLEQLNAAIEERGPVVPDRLVAYLKSILAGSKP